MTDLYKLRAEMDAAIAAYAAGRDAASARYHADRDAYFDARDAYFDARNARDALAAQLKEQTDD